MIMNLDKKDSFISHRPRIMVASDIHGSAKYCNKLVNAFEREEATTLLLLGDLLNHGPRNDLPEDYNPGAVADMLNEYSRQILCVRGNCDSEVDQMLLKFPIMSDYAVLCIDGSFGGYTIFATHGHIYNDKKLPPIDGIDILLCGHTHIPDYKHVGEIRYMNPGSVSIPKPGTSIGDIKDDSNYHGYMMLEYQGLRWCDFDKNIYSSVDISEDF